MRRFQRPMLFGCVMYIVTLAGCSTGESAQARPADLDYISGRVVSDGGSPEAGVWVIAESHEVMANDGRGPDAFRKIVVTDDDGRFLIPDLPPATYDVWVRGYGLVDSKPSWNVPGDVLIEPGTRDIEIAVTRAATPQEAAKVYPANYWYSMLELPSPGEFSAGENDIPQGMTQAEWMGNLKLTCNLCHQIGTAATRLASREAWDVALRKSPNMFSGAQRFGYESFLDVMGDWSERIHAGEIPAVAPPRPVGVERNVVITEWEVSDLYAHPHDISATDRRDPASNPYGPVYLVDYAQDWLITLDPVNHSWEKVRVPTHPEDEPVQGYYAMGVPVPGGHSSFGGAYEHSLALPHNPMIDEHGRTWLTTALHSFEPEYCPEGSTTDSFTVYDSETGEFNVIPTCFDTHHLEFGDGDEGRLWTCSLGWLDTNEIDVDDPSTFGAAQGQAHFMVDSDGDGQGDTKIAGGGYGVYPSPDGSAWNSQIGPNRINRYDPVTDTFETFQPPYGHGPRGITVGSEGVVWAGFAGSGHLGKFDRRKCAQTWGMGDQCPEGWTMYKVPGPEFQGFESDNPEDHASATQLYYIWVDRYNASGLGENTVILNGTGADALFIFDPDTEEFMTIRVPYPLQYNSRGSDARIDDPDAGWKGRGIWSAYSSTSSLLTETRRPSIVQMQIRPNPLAE